MKRRGTDGAEALTKSVSEEDETVYGAANATNRLVDSASMVIFAARLPSENALPFSMLLAI